MNYKTQTGRRPDLEGLVVNPVIGYVGNLIYPTVNIYEKTGTIYYKGLTSDSEAMTGRAAGAEITTTLLTDSHKTYSCTDIYKRYGIEKSEIQQMGGIEKADVLGGKASKRSVMRAIENASISQLMDASATSISGGIISGIEDGADAVRRYAGEMAFVCSQSVYRYIIKQSEITNKLGYTFNVKNLKTADSLSVKSELFRAMLESIIGFDKVLIYDDDHAPAGKTGYAAICKLPDPDEFSHKMDPVLGKTMLYLPDGEQSFEIESNYDENKKINKYDCTSWLDIKELNANAKYVVNGLV